jgi:hypothetical protein
MFTRTLSGATTIGLNEMRPNPSSQQYLRAASTAGAMLAGYFPHLRGAFKFPPHLACLPLPGDALQCTAGQQNPQVGSLISAQGAPACKAEAAEAAIEVDTGVGTDMQAVRESVMATLMDKQYRPRMQHLQDMCQALRVSKMQFEYDAQQATESSQKTRELNRRLCRQLSEVRTERTAALEELERLKQEVERARKETKQAQSENTTLRDALRDTQQEVIHLTLAKLESDSCDETPTETFLAEHISREASTAMTDTSMSFLETGVELGQYEDPFSIEEAVCKCNDHGSWGCSVHRRYADSLLLAHRQVASSIARGPPGLELEAPPGLEFMATTARQQPRGNLHLRLQTVC